MSDGLTLTETLSLTEKLQRAETRALAAAAVIDDLLLYANEVNGHGHTYVSYILWKALIAKSKDLDLTAARELMRKAEEWDRAEGKQDALYARWECDYANLSAERDVLWKSKERWKSSAEELAVERDTLRPERDELAALVEQKNEALEEMARVYAINLPLNPPDAAAASNYIPGSWPTMGDFRKAHEAFHAKPATALADLKARIRREVLEEAAKVADEKATEAGDKCGDLRKGDATRYAYAGVSDSLHGLAAELRRMAGEGK